MSEDHGPLQYATPLPRTRRAIWWLALAACVLGLLIAAGALLSTRQVTVVVTNPAAPAPAAGVKIISPTVPSRITIVQRGKQGLPGTNGTIIARIGDITGGQVLLTVDDANGNPLIPTVSVRKGEIHSFTVGKKTYDMEVVELKNFLTSDDFAVFAIRLAGTALSEEEKITRLIEAVASARNITFIRNGSAHSAADAAEHLNRKYQAARDKILTAKDFIEHIASRSSLSGAEYRVRLPDGSEQTAGNWLTERLREIESAGADAR